MLFQIRLLLIFSVLWMVTLFNLERLDSLILIDNINIASYVYILAGVSLLLLLSIRRLAALSLLTLSIVILLIYTAFHYLVEGSLASSYLMVLEVTALIFSLWISRHLALSVEKVIDTVENAILGSSTSRTLNAEEGELIINQELTRARRFRRPVALVYIQMDSIGENPDQTTLSKNQQIMQNRYLRIRLAHFLERFYKDNGILAWYKGNLVICLPEQDLQTTLHEVQQLYDTFYLTFKLNIRIGVAMFPHDALVYEELIEIANRNIWRASQEMTVLKQEEVRNFAGSSFSYKIKKSAKPEKAQSTS